LALTRYPKAQDDFGPDIFQVKAAALFAVGRRAGVVFLSDYRDVYTALCTDFLIESAARAGHDELLATDGTGKAEIARFLDEAE
jgi:hypothetical protein